MSNDITALINEIADPTELFYSKPKPAEATPAPAPAPAEEDPHRVKSKTKQVRRKQKDETRCAKRLIYITERLDNSLREESERTGISINDIIFQLIDDYFSQK